MRLTDEAQRTCCVEGCQLGAWWETPVRTEWRHGMGLLVVDGPAVKRSDKCWYHANGRTPPEGAR